MSDPGASPAPATGSPTRHRLSPLVLFIAVSVGVLAGGGALAALLLGSGPPLSDVKVQFVATLARDARQQPRVENVTLVGNTDVALADALPFVARAPELTQLGLHTLPRNAHVTGLRATVNGRSVTVALDLSRLQTHYGAVLLVLHTDSVGAAAGNYDVNHAILVAAGQVVHPPDVTFTDQTGRSVPLHSLHGKVVVVAALDTHCHDTCPLYTALWADLQRVLRERGWQDRVVIAEVSMDADRDTPDELAAYGRMVGATWPLLRADPLPLATFWTVLGASYVRAPSPSPAPIDWYTGKPEAYHLHHSSLAVILDQNGDERFELQGNPRLDHALTPALQQLLTGSSVATLEKTTSFSLLDLLDRLDQALGAPPEVDRGVERAAKVGRRAPDVTLPGLDGTTVSLGHQLGRPLVVTFWATWCTPCRHDMPLLAAVVRSHPGLVVLAVDEGESSGQVRDYLDSLLGVDRNQITALLDPGHDGAAAYAVGSGLPVTVFIGADGIVKTVRIGELHADDLGTGLAATGA